MPLELFRAARGSHDENGHLSQVVAMQKTAACETMQPSEVDDTGLEFDAKTACFSGDSQDVVLPVVLKLLESPVFCELVTMWSVLDLGQQQLVFDAVREQARQLGRMTG